MKLTSGQRKALKARLGAKAFGVPSKAPGSGSYPIPDKSHAKNALARASQFGSPEVKAEVRAKVKKRFPNMQVQ